MCLIFCVTFSNSLFAILIKRKNEFNKVDNTQEPAFKVIFMNRSNSCVHSLSCGNCSQFGDATSYVDAIPLVFVIRKNQPLIAREVTCFAAFIDHFVFVQGHYWEIIRSHLIQNSEAEY